MQRVEVAGAGVVLADWAALARDPALAARFEHLVIVDPAPFVYLEELCGGGAGYLHRVDGPREAEFALRVHCDDWPSRASLAALPGPCANGAGRGLLAGDLARAVLCGEAQPSARHPSRRPSARVLAELGLVRWEPADAARALRVVSSEGTDLERSAAFVAYRDRYEEEAIPEASEDRHRAEHLDPNGGASGPRRPARAHEGGRRRPRAGGADQRGHRNLTATRRALLGDLFAVIGEHSANGGDGGLDRSAIEHAFSFSCERHADQQRKSGEDFITHPVEVAKICAGLRLDTETLCAALLHDTVEDTSASLEEVESCSATRWPGSSTASPS